MRIQRRSDGTLQLGGQRFEVPGRFAHLRQLHVRYARWDLSTVDLVDPRTGAILAPLYPLDKQRNASGQRRARAPVEPTGAPEEACTSASAPAGLAPLLRELLAEHAATGLPPAYLPFPSREKDNSHE
jgi:hypothetical protein